MKQPPLSDRRTSYFDSIPFSLSGWFGREAGITCIHKDVAKAVVRTCSLCFLDKDITIDPRVNTESPTINGRAWGHSSLPTSRTIFPCTSCTPPGNQVIELTELNLNNASHGEELAETVYRKALIGLGLVVGTALAWWLGRDVTRRQRGVIDGLAGASNQAAAASDQVASSSRQLAEGASEQAATREETASSLEEMSSKTRQNADNAGQANTLMTQTSRVV
jgi:hypothetical protein